MSKIEVIKGSGRQRFTDEEKSLYLEEWNEVKGNGVSMTSFAKKKGIQAPTFHQWIKKAEMLDPGAQSKAVALHSLPGAGLECGARQGRVETLQNENMVLQKQNQWLKQRVDQCERALGKVVLDYGLVRFETELKNTNL